MKDKVIRFFEWLLKSKLRHYIIEAYRRNAEKELTIKTEIVKAKKGKRRYDLAFFETEKGVLKFNLQRHFDWRINDEEVRQIQGELILK